MDTIYNRIGKKIDLKKMSQDICKVYDIGEYKKYEKIMVGIEDFSYFLWTNKGKYIVKILNVDKTLKQVGRYINQYDIIMKNNIKAPKLIMNKDRHIFIYETDGVYINLCLIEYVDGKDLYSLGGIVTREDIDKLIEILIPLHKIKEKIEVEYGEYNFTSFREVFEKTKNEIPEDIKKGAEELLKEYENIDLSMMPKCYIHGDLINTNVLKDKDGELYLIDFSESGVGIRVLDIVKIITSIIYNYRYPEESIDMCRYFIEEYQKHLSLTEYELECLRLLIKADAYTCYMLEYYDMYCLNQNKTEETKYWLQMDLGIINGEII